MGITRRAWLPALALTLNAFTWGVSWWPLPAAAGAGLHPLWATALIYAVAVVVISLRSRAPGASCCARRRLWVLVLAAGTTNATFNWAMTIGDVVRVVLLFYLMPLWAVLLARLLLGERFTLLAWLRVALALTGAAIVLWPGRWRLAAAAHAGRWRWACWAASASRSTT
jgi:EamA domain-containing membrane protein RarD